MSSSQHSFVKKLITTIIVITLVITTVITAILSNPERAEAAIKFTEGWDYAENSDVQKYSQKEATDFLKGYTSSLRNAIDSPTCTIEVSKGCHQLKDPHFTLKETAKKCKIEPYAGSKNIHIPCTIPSPDS